MKKKILASIIFLFSCFIYAEESQLLDIGMDSKEVASHYLKYKWELTDFNEENKTFTFEKENMTFLNLRIIKEIVYFDNEGKLSSQVFIVEDSIEKIYFGILAYINDTKSKLLDIRRSESNNFYAALESFEPYRTLFFINVDMPSNWCMIINSNSL